MVIRKLNYLFVLAIMFTLLLFNNSTHAAKPCGVEIQNVDKKTAIDYMVNEIVGAGFNLVTVNEYQVIVRRDVDDFMLRALYGSRYNSTPEVRMTLNFSQIDNITKVTAETRIITNPGSAFEKSQIFESDATQKMLDRFKNYLEQKSQEKKPRFGFKHEGSDKDYNIRIIEVTPGSSAEKAGLKVGDKIIKINDIPMSKYDNNSFKAAFAGPEGAKVTLTIKRDSVPDEITMVLEKTIIKS